METKEAPDPTIQYGFVTDEGYREVGGKDMSTVGPGPGNQGAVLEGEMGFIRTQLLRGEPNVEQIFRTSALKYLNATYVQMDASQRQFLIEQALKIPNYDKLFLKILFAALYFRQLEPNLRNYNDLTSEMLDRTSKIVLAPLIQDGEARKLRQKKISMESYITQLKADLLRYLRYLILPK